MKNLAVLSAGGLLAAVLATPVLALSDTGFRVEQTRGDHAVTIRKVECMTDESGMRANCPTQEGDVMIGDVDEIDHVNGTLLLNHRGAQFTLYFPPAAIMDIRKGDTIAIPLGLAEESVP